MELAHASRNDRLGASQWWAPHLRNGQVRPRCVVFKECLAMARCHRPTVQELFVFCLKAAIGSPVHVRRLGRELLAVKGASSAAETIPQPVR
jgi:hypothetical protein